MRIKLQGLLNGALEIRERYGEQELERVLDACRPELRERVASGIAIEWHPRAEFDEFLAAAEQVLGDGSGKVAQQIGARGALQNTRGWGTRALLFVLNPEWVLKKAASTYRQFNDAGDLRLIEFEEGYCVIEMVDLPNTDRYFCAALTGWAQVMGVRIGYKDAVSKHTQCRARGDRACVWETRWGRG